MFFFKFPVEIIVNPTQLSDQMDHPVYMYRRLIVWNPGPRPEMARMRDSRNSGYISKLRPVSILRGNLQGEFGY